MKLDDLKNLVPQDHRDLLFEFFLAFSRFEYALKRAGYVNAVGGKVSANWDKFAAKYNDLFDAAKANTLKEAYDYFREHPPRKQIIADGVLDWSEPNSLDDKPPLIWLFDCIRIVRNNLFHGGKFPVAPIEEPARNPLLLQNALVIMFACLPLDADVNHHFTNVDV